MSAVKNQITERGEEVPSGLRFVLPNLILPSSIASS
jgi:hypothetical protein